MNFLPGAFGLLLGLGQQAAVPHAAVGSPPPHQTFSIASRHTDETRVINVYLPPGYDSTPGTAYPVLYMPDGGMQEDFPHVATTVDSLIRLGRIQPMLLVGVENTQRRRDMTGPTRFHEDSAIAPRVGGSAGFRAFFREELQPEIRRRYRVTGESAIVGESLAGLFIVEAFLLEPTLFDRSIALDPSLWWNGEALVDSAATFLARAGGRPRVLFLASSSQDGIREPTARLAAILGQGADSALAWTYRPRPDLTHGTIYVGVVADALVTVLGSGGFAPQPVSP